MRHKGKNHAVSFEDVFAELEKDPKFRKADRLIKPYFDLLLEIINRRRQLGITQKELAERADTYQSRISKIESGEHDIRLSTLVSIAEALESEVSIRLVPIETKYFIDENKPFFRMFSSKLSPQKVEEYAESEVGAFSVMPVYAENE